MSKMSRRLLLASLPAFALGACSGTAPSGTAPFDRALVATKSVPTRIAARLRPGDPPLYPNETPELRALINKWADHYEVPRDLVHAQVKRESTHNPAARNGPYWGLMQILPQTARTMGFRGEASELLNPDVNLQFGVKYLRGAYMVAKGNKKAAMKWYARGYYYEAKRLGLLEETGLV